MISLVRSQRKTHIVILAFGAAGTGKSSFALQFPNPIIVDAHGTLDALTTSTNARILRTAQPGPINEVLALLRRGTESAATFVIDGLSRVQDEIQAAAPENNSRYYAAVRQRLTTITDAARALPMHVIFTARSKDEYAKTGDIVGGYVVSPDDKFVVGSAPDIDRAIPYDVDLVLEMFVDDSGAHHARVVSSHIAGLPIGAIIDEPDAEKVLDLANIDVTTAARIDFDVIDASHPLFGNNAHLKHLAQRVNDAAGRNGGKSLSARSLLQRWNIWNGSGPLTAEQRVEAVAAFKNALTKKSPRTRTNDALPATKRGIAMPNALVS